MFRANTNAFDLWLHDGLTNNLPEHEQRFFDVFYAIANGYEDFRSDYTYINQDILIHLTNTNISFRIRKDGSFSYQTKIYYEETFYDDKHSIYPTSMVSRSQVVQLPHNVAKVIYNKLQQIIKEKEVSENRKFWNDNWPLPTDFSKLKTKKGKK